MKYAEIERCAGKNNKVSVWSTSTRKIKSSATTRIVRVEDHVKKGDFIWGDVASRIPNAN